MTDRDTVITETINALRLARRYGGKFAQDEREYAQALLDELEADNVFYDRMHRIHDESGRWDSPEMLRFAAVTQRLRDLSKVAA